MNENIKNKRAIALHYHQSDPDAAPKVIGKGKGYVAEEIIKRANEHEIPIQEDPSLVALLSELELNQAIPQELYEVVAEVFSFIYEIDKKR